MWNCFNDLFQICKVKRFRLYVYVCVYNLEMSLQNVFGEEH